MTCGDGLRRVTYGLQKIADTWLIAHDQVSVPLDMASGKGVVDLDLGARSACNDRSATRPAVRPASTHSTPNANSMSGFGLLGFEDAAGEHPMLTRREDLAEVGARHCAATVLGHASAVLGAPCSLLGGHRAAHVCVRHRALARPGSCRV